MNEKQVLIIAASVLAGCVLQNFIRKIPVVGPNIPVLGSPLSRPTMMDREKEQ